MKPGFSECVIVAMKELVSELPEIEGQLSAGRTIMCSIRKLLSLKSRFCNLLAICVGVAIAKSLIGFLDSIVFSKLLVFKLGTLHHFR